MVLNVIEMQLRVVFFKLGPFPSKIIPTMLCTYFLFEMLEISHSYIIIMSKVKVDLNVSLEN